MKRMRSQEQIKLYLDTARAFQAKYRERPSDDPVVRALRSENDREVVELQREWDEACTGQLEIVLDGTSIVDHSVKAGYASRILDGMQGAYRAVYTDVANQEKVTRNESSLALVATSPGSVALHFATAPSQLDLLQDPIADRAIDELFDLLTAADKIEAGRAFAERVEGTQLQAVIRLCGTFAFLGGTVQLKWHGLRGERFAEVNSTEARQLAAALAGQPGREVITVVGHLERASERPTTKVRVVTETDSYSAVVPEDLKDRVKAMLFEDVVATMVIDMSTGVTTGTPQTRVELLDLQPAS